MFGRSYEFDVLTLHNALKVAQREAVAPNRSNTSTLANALGDVARVWTGLFTAKGRALTAAKRIAQRQANRAMINAILDPTLAKRMAELSQLKTGSRRAAIIPGQVGATMLVEPGRIDELLGR